MLEGWNTFWFSHSSAIDLSVARILILGHFIFFKLTESAFDFRGWSHTQTVLSVHWKRPWLLEKIGLPFLNHTTNLRLILVYKAALLSALVGFLTPVSCAISLLLGLYFLGMRHGLKFHHSVMPVHFILLALAIGPSGQYYSVDSWLWPSLLESANPQVTSWSLQFIRVTMALVIFATGIAKLRHLRFTEGFLVDGNLSSLIRIHDFHRFYVSPIISISKYLLRFPTLERLSSLVVLVVEVVFPIALFSDLAAIILVPLMIFLIVNFRLVMGPRFDFFNASILAVFVPWERLLEHLK